MDRSNHYETAFEAYLQRYGLCYVAVDETRRTFCGGEPLKSFDFLVYGPTGARLVVDIKGRRFPGGTAKKPRRVWECWSERADVDGLRRWADVAGPGYRGLLVFSYLLDPRIQLPDSTPDLWVCRGRRYLLRAVDADEYSDLMGVRSPRWDTVCLPRDAFRALARPLGHFTAAHAPTGPGAQYDDDCPF